MRDAQQRRPSSWRGSDAGEDLASGTAGCRISRSGGPAQGGSGRIAAAAPRQQAAPGGERDPAESLGFFRQVGGESMKAKLAFISAHGSTYSIRLLCSVLGVTRSWFQDWQAGAQARSAEGRTEADLVGQIRGIFQDSGERYGAPRVHAELRARGVRIARKRVARIMRENDIRPPRRKKRPPITAGAATASPRTFSSVPSRLIARIRSGWRTLRMWRLTRAGCTWWPSRTWRPARSSAGTWPTI